MSGDLVVDEWCRAVWLCCNPEPGSRGNTLNSSIAYPQSNEAPINLFFMHNSVVKHVRYT